MENQLLKYYVLNNTIVNHKKKYDDVVYYSVYVSSIDCALEEKMFLIGITELECIEIYLSSKVVAVHCVPFIRE